QKAGGQARRTQRSAEKARPTLKNEGWSARAVRRAGKRRTWAPARQLGAQIANRRTASESGPYHCLRPPTLTRLANAFKELTQAGAQWDPVALTLKINVVEPLS